MNRIFTLFFAALVAVVAYAQTPVEGVDYKWAKVSSTMTEVPENFFEGVTKEAAQEYMDSHWSAEMALYGNIPEEGGEFSAIALNADFEIVETSVTWTGAVDNGFAYYPCKIEATPAEYEWTIITSEMTAVPEDFYPGVTQDAAAAYMDEHFSILACLIGDLPAEGEDFDAVILNFDWEYETVKMSWESAVAKYDPEWGDGVAYPRALSPVAIREVRTAEPQNSLKTFEYGRIVILSNGKRYNTAGGELK